MEGRTTCSSLLCLSRPLQIPSLLQRIRILHRCLCNFLGRAKSSLEGHKYFHSFFSANLPATEQEPEA